MFSCRYQRPFVLGWWGRALAWLLVLAVVGVAIFFVWAYALQFGAEKTSRWLTSLIVTFLTSILVVEPLMVNILKLWEATLFIKLCILFLFFFNCLHALLIVRYLCLLVISTIFRHPYSLYQSFCLKCYTIITLPYFYL